jgi:hypothetical protein
LICLKNDFRIGSGRENATQIFKLCPEKLVIVDFTIEIQKQTVVCIGHGLMALSLGSNNGEPAVQ